MNPLLFDVKLLRESREFFESKTPKVLGYFIYLVVFILLGVLLWASFWEIEIMAKAPVLLRPSEYVSVVKNIVPGAIHELRVKNGELVEKGQILWKIDPGTFDIDLEKLRLQRNRSGIQLETLGHLQESLLAEKNLLSSEDSELLPRWQAYISELHRLRLLTEKARLVFEREQNTPEILTTTVKVKELETDSQIALYSLESWQRQQMVQLRSEIEATRREWENLDRQVKSLDKQRSDASVEAPVPGKIEVLKKLNQGDFVGAGEDVLRIVPETQGPLKMEIRLPDKDIAEIRSGLPVRVRMNGLTPSDFGFVTGVVTVVPPDSVTMENGQVLYRIEGLLDQCSVTGRDGKVLLLQSGMTGEARIILKKKTILLYLLEQLDFIS